jgi:hypothetical protein
MFKGNSNSLSLYARIDKIEQNDKTAFQWNITINESKGIYFMAKEVNTKKIYIYIQTASSD